MSAELELRMRELRAELTQREEEIARLRASNEALSGASDGLAMQDARVGEREEEIARLSNEVAKAKETLFVAQQALIREGMERDAARAENMLLTDGRNYFKAAYSRKLDDERSALEAAQAAVAENTPLRAEVERLRVKLELADKACTALARKLDIAEALNTPLVAVRPWLLKRQQFLREHIAKGEGVLAKEFESRWDRETWEPVLSGWREELPELRAELAALDAAVTGTTSDKAPFRQPEVPAAGPVYFEEAAPLPAIRDTTGEPEPELRNLALPLGHAFEPAPYYPDRCNVRVEGSGTSRYQCARPRQEHQS